MKLSTRLSFSSILAAGALISALPASADVTVYSPANGAQVSTPFTLNATTANCSNQTVSAMGYSFDSSPDTTIINSTSVNASVQSSLGNHTLHVKAWGTGGASCVTDIALDVTSNSSGPSIPSNAVSVSSIQAMGNWASQQDSAVSGSASGWTGLQSSPSYGGTARQFSTNYSNYANYRYYVSFGDDTNAENFVYDGWVYLTSSASTIANLEMDMNQVMANGQTVIFGFQCDGWNGTWDYTANGGTPSAPVDVWRHSGASCNVKNWSRNTWHHVQVSYSRDSNGNVSYKEVWLDGVGQAINATVPSAFALNWAPVLLTNFQVDGLTPSASSSIVYLDDLTIYRW